MKKRWIVMSILLLTMCAVVSACGNGSDSNTSASSEQQVTDAQESQMSKEEMASRAEEFSISKYFAGLDSNPVRTNDMYKGKYLKITGQISYIGTDRISIMDLSGGADSWPTAGVSVKLVNDDDVKSISIRHIVTVVGHCTPDGDNFLSDAYLLDDGKFSVVAQIENVPFVSSVNSRNKPELYDCYRLVNSDNNLVILFDQDSVDVQNKTEAKNLELAGEKVKEGDKFEVSGEARYTTLDGNPAAQFLPGVKIVRSK